MNTTVRTIRITVAAAVLAGAALSASACGLLSTGASANPCPDGPSTNIPAALQGVLSACAPTDLSNTPGSTSQTFTNISAMVLDVEPLDSGTSIQAADDEPTSVYQELYVTFSVVNRVSAPAGSAVVEPGEDFTVQFGPSTRGFSTQIDQPYTDQDQFAHELVDSAKNAALDVALPEDQSGDTADMESLADCVSGTVNSAQQMMSSQILPSEWPGIVDTAYRTIASCQAAWVSFHESAGSSDADSGSSDIDQYLERHQDEIDKAFGDFFTDGHVDG